MTIGVYAVKDVLQNRFLSPGYADNDELAIRQFKSNVSNIALWKENPGDFQLFKLANFNDETGEYTADLNMIVNGKGVL